MCRGYLKHVNHMLLNNLIPTGILWTYLADLNKQAQEQIKRIISQLKIAEDITKHLEFRELIYEPPG